MTESAARHLVPTLCLGTIRQRPLRRPARRGASHWTFPRRTVGTRLACPSVLVDHVKRRQPLMVAVAVVKWVVAGGIRTAIVRVITQLGPDGKVAGRFIVKPHCEFKEVALETAR